MLWRPVNIAGHRHGHPGHPFSDRVDTWTGCPLPNHCIYRWQFNSELETMAGWLHAGLPFSLISNTIIMSPNFENTGKTIQHIPASTNGIKENLFAFVLILIGIFGFIAVLGASIWHFLCSSNPPAANHRAKRPSGLASWWISGAAARWGAVPLFFWREPSQIDKTRDGWGTWNNCCRRAVPLANPWSGPKPIYWFASCRGLRPVRDSWWWLLRFSCTDFRAR